MTEVDEHQSVLQIGRSAEMSRVVLEDEILLNTQTSGDRNPLHYGMEAAAASRFSEVVVQGAITSSILNAVVAERLSGPGTVFLNLNSNFNAPVRPRDAITGRVEVNATRQDKPITTVTHNDGTVG